MNRHKHKSVFYAETPKLLIIILSFLIVISFIVLLIANTKIRKERELLQFLNTQLDSEKDTAEKLIDERNELVKTTVSKYLPGIVCWGDSLTAGAGGNGVNYPAVLKKCIEENIFKEYDVTGLVSTEFKYLSNEKSINLDTNVVNMGIGGETTNTILGRNGAVPYVLTEELFIPASQTQVEIKFASKNGNDVFPLKQGNKGIESVIIAGVEGTISYDKNLDIYYFERPILNEKNITIPEGTEIEAPGWDVGLNYISVIFMGQNDHGITASELISKQKAMLERQTNLKDRYIIIGLHTETASERADMEKAMEKQWGEKYINLREYMSNDALKDAGITPTAIDEDYIREGKTPPSLLSDNVHFTATGYELIGKLIFERMDLLGYFNEVKSAMGI